MKPWFGIRLYNDLSSQSFLHQLSNSCTKYCAMVVSGGGCYDAMSAEMEYIYLSFIDEFQRHRSNCQTTLQIYFTQ